MACHDRHDAFVDQFFVYSSICGVPFVAVEFINAHDQMLVVFLCPVAREVFHTGRHILRLHSFEERFCIANDIIRIIIECTELNDRISPVIENIHDRCEIPVAAHCRSFTCGDRCHLINRVLGINGSHCGAVCDRCPAAHTAVPALLTVGCDQKRDLRVLLEAVRHIPQFFLWCIVVSDRPGMIGIKDFLDIFRFSLLGISHHIYKKLTDLLLDRHPCDSILYPLYLLIIQIVRFFS